jgi:hypothetical protein
MRKKIGNPMGRPRDNSLPGLFVKAGITVTHPVGAFLLGATLVPCGTSTPHLSRARPFSDWLEQQGVENLSDATTTHGAGYLKKFTKSSALRTASQLRVVFKELMKAGVVSANIFPDNRGAKKQPGDSRKSPLTQRVRLLPQMYVPLPPLTLMEKAYLRAQGEKHLAQFDWMIAQAEILHSGKPGWNALPEERAFAKAYADDRYVRQLQEEGALTLPPLSDPSQWHFGLRPVTRRTQGRKSKEGALLFTRRVWGSAIANGVMSNLILLWLNRGLPQMLRNQAETRRVRITSFLPPHDQIKSSFIMGDSSGHTDERERAFDGGERFARRAPRLITVPGKDGQNYVTFRRETAREFYFRHRARYGDVTIKRLAAIDGGLENALYIEAREYEGPAQRAFFSSVPLPGFGKQVPSRNLKQMMRADLSGRRPRLEAEPG